jgi:hypothetical protein
MHDARDEDGWLAELAPIDAILDRHRADLADDFTAYRNHAHRVATLCAAEAGDGPEAIEKIAIAAAFHDLGIWADRTFDYLEPSVRLAGEHLLASGRAAWLPAVTAAIHEHHRITRYRGDHAWLVETFRRADWMDVTGGIVASGLSRELFRAALVRWPREGFHRLLARLALRHARSHPSNPLPMLKL